MVGITEHETQCSAKCQVQITEGVRITLMFPEIGIFKGTSIYCQRHGTKNKNTFVL